MELKRISLGSNIGDVFKYNFLVWDGITKTVQDTNVGSNTVLQQLHENNQRSYEECFIFSEKFPVKYMFLSSFSCLY